jgi:hypothetical protein
MASSRSLAAGAMDLAAEPFGRNALQVAVPGE